MHKSTLKKLPAAIQNGAVFTFKLTQNNSMQLFMSFKENFLFRKYTFSDACLP